MWISAQPSHAITPPKRSLRISPTAWPRPITASWPLSKYRNVRRGRPATPSRMARATCLPIWIAPVQVGGTEGSPRCSNQAASPITNTSGWPGIEQSGSTSTLPWLVSGTPRDASSGDASLPAAQITVVVGIRQPPASTASSRTSVTSVLTRTSTPSRRRSSLARSESDSGYDGRMRGPASTSITVVSRVSMWRKSWVSA